MTVEACVQAKPNTASQHQSSVSIRNDHLQNACCVPGAESRDNDALCVIMGHAEIANDLSAVYNKESVEDGYLRAVTDYVRAWLFPPATAKETKR